MFTDERLISQEQRHFHLLAVFVIAAHSAEVQYQTQPRVALFLFCKIFYGVKKFVYELELIEKKEKWYLPLKPLLLQRRRSCRDHVTFNIYLTLQPTTVSRCPLKHHR